MTSIDWKSKDSIITWLKENGIPQKEDEFWYDLITLYIDWYTDRSMSEEPCIEHRVFLDVMNYIESLGYDWDLDGEKDSFGLVTCGIFINGEIMCLV